MKRWWALAAALLAGPSLADVLYLKDGSKLEGKVERDGLGWVVTDPSGRTTRVRDQEVSEVEIVGTATLAAEAESSLRLLRRTTENQSSIPQIIEQYTRFLERYAHTPAASQARQELQKWQDRQAAGMVKAAGRWLTPQEYAQFLRQILPMIQEARQRLKEGRYPLADQVVSRLLQIDAENPAGLYLRGIIQYRSDQIAQARKSFERVREILGEHGPTLNNLAVIAFRQQQYATALALYERAMAAWPANRIILDNVAEALHALPEAQRDSQLARRIAETFRLQDADLQQRLAEDGLTRWGAVYITREQAADARKVQVRLDLLAEEYEKNKTKLAEIDRQLRANAASMDRIERDRMVYDWATGRFLLLPRSPIHDDLRAENDRLRAERQELLRALSTYHQREQAIISSSPVRPYTGLQHLIEAQGVPFPDLAGSAGSGPAGAGPLPATQPH